MSLADLGNAVFDVLLLLALLWQVALFWRDARRHGREIRRWQHLIERKGDMQ